MKLEPSQPALFSLHPSFAGNVVMAVVLSLMTSLRYANSSELQERDEIENIVGWLNASSASDNAPGVVDLS